jgi:hypothetical protein
VGVFQNPPFCLSPFLSATAISGYTTNRSRLPSMYELDGVGPVLMLPGESEARIKAAINLADALAVVVKRVEKGQR